MVPAEEKVELALAPVTAICLLVGNEVSFCILMINRLTPRLETRSILRDF